VVAVAALMGGRWTSDVVAWAALALAVLLILGWYLSVSAARLDRLHHRVESSFAALTTQLVRRAAVALEAVTAVDASAGLLIADAAAEAMGPWPDDEIWDEHDTENQNDLSRALDDAFGDAEQVAALRADRITADTLDALGQACVRVQIARRFHNDAVAAAQRRRRKLVVRWARLAGHAPVPTMVDFDDSVPVGLSPAAGWARQQS
jgi:hypothetical protein